MTPPQRNFIHDDDLGTSEHDRKTLSVWLAYVPELSNFTSCEQLLGRLRAAAASRRPDPVLRAVCELSAHDEHKTLPYRLLSEAFAPQLERVGEGLQIFTEPDVADRWRAYEALELVVADGVLVGEEPVGRVIVSRTWAQCFHARLQTESVVLAEAAALLARAALVVRDHLALWRSRSLRDRIAGRLSPLREADYVRRDAAQTGLDVDDLAAERGLSPLVVRRQLRELDSVPSGRILRLSALQRVLTAAHHGGPVFHLDGVDESRP